jgi:ABC-type sugar transport system substrate-binding protein
MKKRTLLKSLSMLWATAMLSGAALASEKLNVTFINPGKITEPFWVGVSSFMKAAADDLGMNLEVIYLERDHTKQVPTATDLTKRAKKPDYVVMVNEKLVAADALKALDAAGVKSFLILNDLTDAQKAEHGKPRDKYKNWIGTMTPNNVDAGQKIATALFAEAKGKGFKSPDMIAISGNRATPASVERKEGLDLAIKAAGELSPKLKQEVWAEFEEGKAYEMTKGLLTRYPDVKIIWAANDPMAIGAMRAVKEAGKTPGKDVLLGGLNWSTPALEALKSKEFAVSVGGHFMTGGWAMVAIYDHANGIDFSGVEGTEMNPDVFGSLTGDNADTYIKTFGKGDWDRLNFNNFSRKNNPKLKKYDFGLASVLKSVK